MKKLSEDMKKDAFGEKDVNVFGWECNPFSFKILPELFVGHEKEVKMLYNSLRGGSKFITLLGPTGSGKTTMLQYLSKVFPDSDSIFYISKPPKKADDWKLILVKVVNAGFFSRLFSKRDISELSLYELGQWVNRKMKNKKILLLVDEVHETAPDSLEWLRTLTDQIENMSVVMAGLPVFDRILRENLETLRRRIETTVELTNLTLPETREMIKKRVEWAGGEDIKPFTSNSVHFIYEKTNGFPREVLRMCGELVNKAVKSGVSTIDMDLMKEGMHKEARVTMNALEELPYRQKSILEILSSGGEMTPTQVVGRMNPKEYEDKGNAIRSVNNILRRLMKDHMVIRERRGKAYKYRISPKFQTMLVNA